MPSEDRYGEVLRSGDASQEASFDELARGLARGTLSRGRVLKILGTLILGGLLVPGCSTLMDSQEEEQEETQESTTESTTESATESVEGSANTPVEEPISSADEYLETEGPIGEPVEEAIGGYDEYLDESGEGPTDGPEARATSFCRRCRQSEGECCTKHSGLHLCCQGGTKCTEMKVFKSKSHLGEPGEGYTDYVCA